MVTFFEIAYMEAERGILAGDGDPFGAVVVKDSQVIGQGHNCVLSSHDSTAHAEIMAIRQAEKTEETHDLTGCEIYTTCYPCLMCLGAIMLARISRVHYACTAKEAAAVGFDDRALYEAISNPNTNKLLTLEHHDNTNCSLLFQKWLGINNNQLY